MVAALGPVLGGLAGAGLAANLFSKKIGDDDKTKVTAVTPVKPPTTEERAQGITDAAKEAQLKKKARKGFSSTILTSPLGVEQASRTNLKSLLGE